MWATRLPGSEACTVQGERTLSVEQTLGINTSALSAPDCGCHPFRSCLGFPEMLQFLTWSRNLENKSFSPLKLLSVRASVIHKTRTMGEKPSNPSEGHFCAAWSPAMVGAVLAEARQCSLHGGVKKESCPEASGITLWIIYS